MYLIDETYLTGKLKIANVGEYTGAETINIDNYIDKFARQFLQETLGYVLFKDLDSNITAGALDAGAPQKWKDLVNGVEYTKDGETYYWRGLLHTEGVFKESILARYVYLNYFENYMKSENGLAILSAKNADAINPTQHLVEVYNDFVEMYQGVCNNQPYVAFYNGTLFKDYSYNVNSGYVSYLQFLNDKEADYPNAPKQVLNYKNSLDV